MIEKKRKEIIANKFEKNKGDRKKQKLTRIQLPQKESIHNHFSIEKVKKNFEKKMQLTENAPMWAKELDLHGK